MPDEQKRLPDPNRPVLNLAFPNLKIKPKKFETIAELEDKIEQYFGDLASHTEQKMSATGAVVNVANPLIPTLESLAAYLGMSRECLYDYGNADSHEQFHETIAIAKDRILGLKTLGLVNGKGSAAGLIFDLVNNHGYKNKQEVASENKNDTTIRVVYE